MEDISTYQIQIRGQAEIEDLNAMSPLHLSVARVCEGSTFLSVRTDQAGMIGLIRHLHGLGLTLLSVSSDAAFENSPF